MEHRILGIRAQSEKTIALRDVSAAALDQQEVFGEFSACVEDEVKKNVDKHFRSLDILETIL